MAKMKYRDRDVEIIRTHTINRTTIDGHTTESETLDVQVLVDGVDVTNQFAGHDADEAYALVQKKIDSGEL